MRSSARSLLASAIATMAVASPCGLKWSTWYEADPVAQNGSLNLLFTNNATWIDWANDSMQPKAAVLYDLFFELFVLRPYVNGSYFGYTLRPDYVTYIGALWNSTMKPLASTGRIAGFWLGDEVCWNGVSYQNLTLAAAYLKQLWPESIVYVNEAEPVMTQGVDQWGELLHYGSIPAGIDWFSIDYYRLDSSSWEYPQTVVYPQYIYPRMNTNQCALLVPGAYGSDANPSFSLQQYESFMVQQASAYYAWAKGDPKIVGINPWYWTPVPPNSGLPALFDYAASQMPGVAAAWKAIGAEIAAAATAAASVPSSSPGLLLRK